MACPHKFHEYLNLDLIDFEPTTLIVGTFNPSWPQDNNANWFYGRTHDAHGNQNNNFWDVLPRIYDEPSLIEAGPNEWKDFCRDKSIALTDLIMCIEDANEDNEEHIRLLRSFSDKSIASQFNDHITVDIIGLIQNHPTISNIYFTRGLSETFWRLLWLPIREYALENNLHEASLLTPSGYAFYQQSRYNNRNPHNQIQHLPDFILSSWQQNWHEI